MDRRLLLQAARPDRFDVDLDLGCMRPRIELVGEQFLMLSRSASCSASSRTVSARFGARVLYTTRASTPVSTSAALR